MMLDDIQDDIQNEIQDEIQDEMIVYRPRGLPNIYSPLFRPCPLAVYLHTPTGAKSVSPIPVSPYTHHCSDLCQAELLCWSNTDFPPPAALKLN